MRERADHSSYNSCGSVNIVDQFLIRSQRGITISSVIISIVIAVVVYLALIYFFGRKHLN